MAEEQQEQTNTDNTPDTPLVDWINAPKVSDLSVNLTDARETSDTHTTALDKWRDNMHITGAAKLKKIPGSSSIQPKLIRKQAEWRYAPLTEPFLSTPDVFNVGATTAGDKNRAKQNQLVLNNQINTKMKKVAFFDKYIRSTVDSGTAIVKVGWHNETRDVTTQEPVYEYIPDLNPMTAERYMALAKLQQENPEGYADYSNPGLDKAISIFLQTGQLFIPNQTGTEEVTKEVEVANHPTWEVKNQRNVRIDPSCNGDLTKAKFIGESFKTSKSELNKQGDRYSNLDKINVEGTASPLANPDYVDGNEDSNFEFKDKPRKQFVVTEYWGEWDIDNSGIATPIVAAWVGDVIIRLEKNPFPFQRPPYILVNYMPKEDSLFGEPDGELLLDNQNVVGSVSRGMLDLLGKSANSQTGMRKDMLDATNKRKFRKGQDYEYNGGVDPRLGTFTHKYPEIPQSAYNMITMHHTEAESMSGVKAFANTGITGQGMGSTATSARTALDAASKREIGILRRLAEGIIEIGRMFISMNAEWLSEEETIRITADNFVNVRRDDLAGNFDLSLTISSAEEDNMKASELAFMLQTTGPNSDPGEVRIIRAEIARLRKMPALAKMIEDYRPEPDPMQVAEAQLNIELLKKQIVKEEALAMKHAAEAELAGARGYKETTQGALNEAKVGTEGAKTTQLHSDASKKNLDTIEQETGVTQERTRQLQDDKSQNNLIEKAVDSMNGSAAQTA